MNTMIVLSALDQVSHEQRQVLVEPYYRGRSVTEAVTELGIPPGTVKSRSYHALRAVRQVLGGTSAGAGGDRMMTTEITHVEEFLGILCPGRTRR